MSNITVRQDVLSEITGCSVASIRHKQAHDYTPWPDGEFEEGKHRRYDGRHAVTIVLADQIAAQGVSNADASEFVRAHAARVNAFLDQIERGEVPEPVFVAAFYEAEEDSLTNGIRWTMVAPAGGTAEELVASVARCLSRVGQDRTTRKGRTVERTVAGPRVAVASVGEAYRVVKARAEVAGYGIEGRRFYQLPEAARTEA